MQRSTLIEALSRHDRLRRRIEAIVQTDRWSRLDADLAAPIPTDQLAWGAAATLCPDLEPEDGDGVEHNVDQLELTITDDQLEPFILDTALPRLQPKAQPGSAGKAAK